MLRKLSIGLMTIIVSSVVGMASGGVFAPDVAYAAKTFGIENTSAVAAEEELPDETVISEADETSGATETTEADETSGMAETSEVAATEEVPADTEISAASVTSETAVVTDVPAATEGSGLIVVELNSGAERNGEFITVNEEFQTESASLALIMSGLKEGNKESLLNALAQYFDPDGEKGVKVVDAALADAEKWCDDDGDPTAYDANQCWAASASNMLWVSGWAQKFVNPATGANFASEDEVFSLFNTSFTDRGSEVSSGIDWFFMGEYYASDIGSHASLIDKQTGGYMKSFVSTLAQHRYAMKEDDGYISQLERIDASSESPAVFQLSLGSIDEGTISSSIHSVTLAGVIIDPNTTSLENRYKGIAIVNSDDDAVPSAEAQQITDPTFEQKQADKAARPNSCTFYPLRHMYDANGTPCWEIVGYSEVATTVLYALNALELPSDDLISKYTETEGDCSLTDAVDLTLESAITTDETEPITDYWHYSIFADDYKCYEFESDEPVNLNYFAINRSQVIMDTEYKGEKDLSVSWKVTKDSDGTVVAEGTSVFEENLYSNSEAGAMIHLNQVEGGLAAWEAGSYTATISLNPDRAIKEAYYLNNVDQSVKFTIVGSDEQGEDSGEPDSGDSSGEPASGDSSGEPASGDTSGEPASGVTPQKPGENGASKTTEASKKTASKKSRDDTNTGDMASDGCRDSLLLLSVSVAGLLVVLRRRRTGYGK